MSRQVPATRFPTADVARLRVALAKIARSVDRQVSGGKLTRTQLSVLGTVTRLGPLGVSELADIEGLNPTMLSRVIGKLQSEGLLARAPDERDRRAVTVQATRAGKELHQRLRRERERLLAERLRDLPAEHARELLAALPALESLAERLRRPESALAAVAGRSSQ